jgi:hypothetical protein
MIHLHTLLLLLLLQLMQMQKLFKLLFVLRNVFPVEWGIFAFSSIIIVTKNISLRTPLEARCAWRDACRYGRLIVAPLLSSRGVLKWHSLLKVHLAINDSSFGSSTVEIGKRLARSLSDARGPGNAFRKKKRNTPPLRA